LKRRLPKNTNLVFWYFNDEMYLVISKPLELKVEKLFSEVKSIKINSYTILNSEISNVEEYSNIECLWWCGTEFDKK
jgi:hypothetical protein